MTRGRWCLLALLVCLSPGAGRAQDPSCSQRCTDGMGSCMSGCTAGEKCGTSCGKRVTECLGRCVASKPAQPQKDKQCVGADGKRMQCFDFKKPPPPKAEAPEPPQK